MPLPFPTAKFAKSTKLFPTNVRKDRRRMFRRFPLMRLPGFAPICCDTHDPRMQEAAYIKRLLRDVPDPDPKKLKALATYVDWFLKEYVPVAKVGTYEAWRDGLKFPQARIDELNEANELNRGGRPPRSIARKVQSFCKTEFYTAYKFARTINSRCDRFKAYSGRFFKAVDEVLYPLTIGGFHCFAKHLTRQELGAEICALRGRGKYTYSNDFTAYESHFVATVMNICECALYRHCLQLFPDDAEYICGVLTGVNKMHMRGGTRAEVKARRMSGDMCTSLGNGFTNLVLAHFLAHEQGKEIVGPVEGDDGLFSTDAHLTPERYAELGFTIKITLVDDPRKASFCGMLFSEDGEIIKNPVKFMVGMSWTHSFINAGDAIMAQLLRAKALSSVYETPQCPILGALSRAALKVTRGVKPRFVPDGYHKLPPDEMPIPKFEPKYSTRSLFADEFGVSIDEQIRLETLIEEGEWEEASRSLAETIRSLGDENSKSVLDMYDYERKYIVTA